MRFRLDAWQSDYAFPVEPTEGPAPENTETVDVAVEAPGHEWAPITPEPAAHAFDVVRFVDGVQSSDAVIWISDPERADPLPGLVASWGAGVITCRPGAAELEHIRIERGVFSEARSLGPIIAGNLTWRPRPPDPAETIGGSGGSDPMALRERLGAARRRLEDAVGRIGATPGEDGVIVYDGLLHGTAAPLTAAGLAKRAHRLYLPPELQQVQRRLARGQRTPLFSTDPQRRRLSFYLALSDPLPPAVADPGSCVARMEIPVGPDTSVAEAARFADRVATTLPVYASEPHVDPRAPQNLMPIRSLEQELRRLLGRPSVIRPLLATEAAHSNALAERATASAAGPADLRE